LFLFYRIVISAVLAVLSVLVKKFDRKDIAFHRTLALAGVMGSAVTIELMIMRLGGHISNYYVGQILLVIVVLGFIPAGPLLHLAAAALIYAIYLVPICALDTITELKPFLAANI
jgi:hypothetical protein